MTRFGLQLWSQHTDWAGFRDAALRADTQGWDSVWTWDHLLAIFFRDTRCGADQITCDCVHRQISCLT